MTKQIKYIIQGARKVLVLMPPDKYVLPSKDGFSHDAQELRKDSKRVIKGLNKVMSQHGK